MGKDKRKDKGKAQYGSSGQSKPTSSSSTSQPNSAQKTIATANNPKPNPNPNPKSAHTGEVHTDPKVAPQAPMGPVLQAPVGNDSKQSTSTSTLTSNTIGNLSYLKRTRGLAP
jgi:hypothetical protein